jgi:hypothetical protein
MTCNLPSPIALALAIAIAAAFPAHLRAEPDDADEQSPALIATADFNRDGIADVAKIIQPDVDRSEARVLEILIGQKDGTFRTRVNLTLTLPNPQSIAAGDFNGDGNPDLLIGDENGAVIELLGDGQANLKFAGEITHVGSAVSIAVGDFNRDGIPDVAVSDFHGNSVNILLGTGGGSFRTGWSFALPQRGIVYYLAAADFNGDGVSDLAITGGEEGTFVVMLGNGNGTFTYAPNLSNIRDPNSYCPT